MTESRLIIVMDDRKWTSNALHKACALSRRSGAGIVLLKMVPVRHPLMLGDYAGYMDLSFNDTRALEEMAATAEDYGVPLDVRVFPYASYWPGIVDAAEQLRATVVVARVPPSHIPFWQKVRHGLLLRRLARQRQMLWGPEELACASDAADRELPDQFGQLAHQGLA